MFRSLKIISPNFAWRIVFYNYFIVLLTCNTAIAGERYVSVSTGSPLFAYRLLNKAAQGLPIGGVTDNVSVLAGRSVRYGIAFAPDSTKTGGWVGDVSIGLFDYRLLKPNGIGVFVDPVTIRSKAVMVEVEGGYRQKVQFQQRHLFSATASLGAQLSYATISAKSKVLNIRESLFSINPYVQLKIDRRFLADKSAQAWVSARFSTNSYKELSAGVSYGF